MSDVVLCINGRVKQFPFLQQLTVTQSLTNAVIFERNVVVPGLVIDAFLEFELSEFWPCDCSVPDLLIA